MPTSDPSSFELIKWAWTVLSLPIAWIVWVIKGNSSNVREVEKDLSAHKLYAANNFVKQHDLKDTEDRILKAIGDLKDDLKSKADK